MHVVELRGLYVYLYRVMAKYHTLRASGRAVRGGGDGAERGDVWAEPPLHPSLDQEASMTEMLRVSTLAYTL
jgi:hypothetical protein